MLDVRRREFITLLGGAAAWPLAARAQQTAMPVIGYLGANTPSAENQRITAFVQRLRELGWIEGRTIAIEVRWAEGRSERFAEIAAEFVRLKVDVIVTVESAALAARQVTSTVPIVFAAASDPLGGGLVASLARPGGNATGLSMQAPDAAGKRLELLREVLPGLRRLAVIGNVGYPAAVQEIAEVRSAARTLGLNLDVLEIRSAEDIAGTFPALKAGSQALYVCADPLVNANHARINTLALGARLPTMHPVRDFLGAGGFMSYGPSLVHLFRRAADYADKIMRGAKPSDLPVEQPTKFDLVFNLTTARALDYLDRREIAFEYRSAEGQPERLAFAAKELAGVPVDIIVTSGTAATRAAQQATSTIPIVMIAIGDPVRAGLVPNLARPGGNITGNSMLGAEMTPKRAQLLKELVPQLSRLAFLWNRNNASHFAYLDEWRAAVPKVDAQLLFIEVSRHEEFEPAFEKMVQERADALSITADPFHLSRVAWIIDFVAKHRLPTMYVLKENVAAGGLMSYGPSIPDLYRRAASYVHKILQGTSPADLPVEQPVKFELAINTRTARAVGLDVPPMLLALADEVIE